MIPEPTQEGTIPFREWETWYRISGDTSSDLTPLVVVHGGPGAPHNYLLSIATLSADGRPVIHYDQLGCGSSTHLREKPADFWTVELFLDELDNLLETLGVSSDYYLLGQSWGGMLGAEHAIRQPRGLRGLILSNSPASMELWVSEAKKLRADLPEEVRHALDRHEIAGTTQDPEYLEATQVFYDHHVCRVLPNPAEVLRTTELLDEDPTVYHTMNGPNEFFCIGSLRNWSVVDRVHSITAPTLLASGRYDEATPVTVQPFFDNIVKVRWEIFQESSHMPFVEEMDHYMSVVRNFLEEYEK